VPRPAGTSELPTYRPAEWMADAACRGLTHVMFPTHASGSGRPNHDQTVSAYNLQYALPRLICRSCPVIDQCRAQALADHERDGMWGGMDPKERARWHRANTRPPSSTVACVVCRVVIDRIDRPRGRTCSASCSSKLGGVTHKANVGELNSLRWADIGHGGEV